MRFFTKDSFSTMKIRCVWWKYFQINVNKSFLPVVALDVVSTAAFPCTCMIAVILQSRSGLAGIIHLRSLCPEKMLSDSFLSQ